jgi:hypothetical protein
MIVRVAPNSDRAKEITKEHATEVFRYNKKGNSPKKADSQYH